MYNSNLFNLNLKTKNSLYSSNVNKLNMFYLSLLFLFWKLIKKSKLLNKISLFLFFNGQIRCSMKRSVKCSHYWKCISASFQLHFLLLAVINLEVLFCSLNDMIEWLYVVQSIIPTANVVIGNFFKERTKTKHSFFSLAFRQRLKILISKSTRVILTFNILPRNPFTAILKYQLLKDIYRKQHQNYL